MRAKGALAAVVLGLALAAGPGARAGEAEIRFVAPERFTDASLHGGRRVDAGAPALRELARHIARLAERQLPAGQVLEVEITDVDLAGRHEPWRLEAPDLRVVTPGTWPRISLRYRLRDGARVLDAGEAVLRDQAFDLRPGHLRSQDPLHAEKAMLDDWFRTRFAARSG